MHGGVCQRYGRTKIVTRAASEKHRQSVPPDKTLQHQLNSLKFTFGVPAGKFLGFMLTCRGIEANPNKCRAVLEMQSPTGLKEVQSLVGRLTTLSRFIPKLVEHIKPILKNMKKGVTQHSDNKCEAAFTKIKDISLDLQLWLAQQQDLTCSSIWL